MFVIPRKASQITLKHFYTFTALVFLYLAWFDPYLAAFAPQLLPPVINQLPGESPLISMVPHVIIRSLIVEEVSRLEASMNIEISNGY